MTLILIVDDDLSACRAMGAGLRRPDREILLAADGEEALMLAHETAPDIVVSDVRMPRRDGWSLVEELRRRRETALTPIIFTSGHSSPHDRVRALRLGAVDFLAKPFELDELSIRIDRAIDVAANARRILDGVLATGLAGSIAHMSIASLLHVLAMDRETGAVDVVASDASGELLLRDGAIVAARFIDDESEVEGAEAVYRLVQLVDGQFTFAQRPVKCVADVHESVGSLLLAARHASEAAQPH